MRTQMGILMMIQVYKQEEPGVSLWSPKWEGEQKGWEGRKEGMEGGRDLELAGKEVVELFSNGGRLCLEWGDVLEMEGGDGGTTRWMELMPLNCKLENGENCEFYAMSILPQFKKTDKRSEWSFPQRKD